jgi:4-amino-4-deoxy-L-arabinose transferase-like glycosyltransferase
MSPSLVDLTRPATSDRPAPAPVRLSAAWLVVLLLAVALVPFVQELTHQPAVRFAQSAALVEDHSVRLDRLNGVVGVDRLERGGHLYGDKAPLQPLLAAPAYAVERALGAQSASVLRPQGNLSLWWVTLWSTVIPLLAIAYLGVKVSERVVGATNAARGALAICAGTLLFAYGSQLYAHVLAGLLGWACWLLVDRSHLEARSGGHPLRWALAAGALGGAALATEYPMAIILLGMAAILVIEKGWTRLAAFCAGVAPFAALLAIYQAAAYGSPFAVSYGAKPYHQSGTAILELATAGRLAEVLVGPRGLLLFSPVVALAVWGLVRLARSVDQDRRRHGIVGLVVFASFVVLQASWLNPWGGESYGPRYLIPGLPFLIVGMVEVWEPAARVRWLAVTWSVAAMSLAVIALHLVPDGAIPMGAQLQSLRTDGPVPTLWTLALGPAGWYVQLATIACAAHLLQQRLAQDEAAAHLPERDRALSRPLIPVASLS